MGFFSKMFKLREQDPDSQETTWAFEDNASELVLETGHANTLTSEFDIDAAIIDHETWRERLREQLSGANATPIDKDEIGNPEANPLGRWLAGRGQEMLGHYPAFQILVARHLYFHTQALQVVELAQAGEYDQALRVFQGGYRHASNQVVLLLKQLKRDLAR